MPKTRWEDYITCPHCRYGEDDCNKVQYAKSKLVYTGDSTEYKCFECQKEFTVVVRVNYQYKSSADATVKEGLIVQQQSEEDQRGVLVKEIFSTAITDCFKSSAEGK